MNTTLDMIISLIDNLTGPLRGTAQSAQGVVNDMEKGMTAAFTRIASGVLSIWGAFDFAKNAVTAAAGAQQALDDLRNSVETTGGSWDKSHAAINGALNAADQFSNYTRTELTNALSQMVLKTGDAAASSQALGLAVDIAEAKHISLAAAADLVGGAMNGNARVVKELGLSIQDGETIFQAMADKFSGFNANEAPTFQNAMRGIAKAWEEFKVQVGESVIAVNENGDSINTFVALLKNLGPPVAAVFGIVVQGLNKVIEGWQLLGATLGAGVNLIGSNFKQLAGYIVEWVGGAIIQTVGQIPVIGKQFQEVGANMLATGKQMVADAKTSQDNMKAGYRDLVDDIVFGQDTTLAHHKQTLDAALDYAKDHDAKMAKEAQTQADAALKIFTNLISQSEKLTEQFTKDFQVGGSTASATISAQIAAVTAEIAKLQTALTTTKGLTAEQTAAIQGSITKLQEERQGYELVLPVMGQVNDLAATAAQLAQDEAQHNEKAAGYLAQEQALLDQLNRLKVAALGNSQAEAAIDKLIASVTADMVKASADNDANIKASATDTQNWNTKLTTTQDRGIAINNAIQTVGDSIRGRIGDIEQVTQHLGGWAKPVNDTLQSLNGMVGAIQSASSATNGFTQALSFGNLTSLAGAAMGLAGAITQLFNDPKKAAEMQLLRDNSAALQKLTEAENNRIQLDQPGNKVFAIQNALKDAEKGGGFNLQAFAADLTGAGYSMADVEDIAKSYGITIDTSTPQQAQKTLTQFGAALAAAPPSAFGGGYSGDLSQTQFTETVTGSTPNQQLYDYGQLAAKYSPFLGAQFEGINFADAGSLETLKGRLTTIAQDIGGLSQDAFGQLTPQQFEDFITAVVGLIPQAESALNVAGPVTPPSGAASGSAVSTGAGGGDTGSIISPDLSTAPPPSAVSSDVGNLPAGTISGTFGLADLGDLLGGKIDGTNDRLDTISKQIDDLILATEKTGGIAPTVSLDDQLASAATMATLNAGG